MTELEIPTWVAMAGPALVAVLALAVVALWRARVRHGRRLAGAVLRLEETPRLDGSARLDHLLTRLELGIDRVVSAEGDSHRREERMRLALDAVPHGVVVCDDTGAITFRNHAASDDPGGRHVDAVLERAVEEVLRLALAGEPQRRTLELYGPPRRVMELRSAPLSAGYRTGGAVAVMEDVSERRRVEAMRRDFVANISHELKTPIAALGLLAETLADEEEPAVVKRLADRLQDDAQRVARTVDDLLELSRIEAEDGPQRERVALHLVLAEAVARVRPLAAQAKVAVELTEPEEPFALVCDRRQIGSAVFNLVENAVKYSDRGGRVDVAATRDEGDVVIEVADHGIGIPERDLERIFERFYRVDRGRSRRTGGTGLGLAIVRHVATNHHGGITVESSEGEGSVFRLRLPAAPGAAPEDAEAAGRSATAPGRTRRGDRPVRAT